MFRITAVLTLCILLPLPSYATSPFEARVRAYEKADKRHAPPAGAVLFAGSSSIEFWKTLAEDFPKLVTLNRGVAGSQYRDLVELAPRLIVKYHPSQIVLYSGDNDVASGKTAEQIAELAGQLLSQLRTALPETPITIISVKPSLAQLRRLDEIRKTNTLLENLVKGFSKVQFVDVQSEMLDAKLQPRPELFRKDGLHMNEKGYAIWARLLSSRLGEH